MLHHQLLPTATTDSTRSSTVAEDEAEFKVRVVVAADIADVEDLEERAEAEDAGAETAPFAGAGAAGSGAATGAATAVDAKVRRKF